MKKLLVALLGIPLLAGCSNGGGSDNDPQIGYLTYTGIGGLEYRTASQSGITGRKGEFFYYPGERVTFSLGDLVIARDIPAKYRLSPLELDPTLESQLFQSTVKDGLSTHTEVESSVMRSSNYVINWFRFLATLDTDTNLDNGIFIEDDIREQIHRVQVDEPINFNQPPETFGSDANINAPENRFIWAICFPNNISTTCESPTGGRAISGSTTTISFVEKELNRISNEIGSGIRFTPFAFELAAGDTQVQTVQIKTQVSEQEIAELEVLSRNEELVRIHGIDRIGKEFSFFVTDAARSKDRIEIVANIRLEGDYRWHAKSLSISIQ